MRQQQQQDPRQVLPVAYAHRPACGVKGHDHPFVSYTACPAAMIDAAPDLRTPSGARTPLAQTFVDEWFDRSRSDHAAFHRAMCETPFTSLRDVDTAFEIEAGAKARLKEQEDAAKRLA